jgi:hypothetical protein
VSVDCTKYAWDSFKEGGSKKLVMLAIADICDDLGVCYPGIKRIAESACLSERYTQKFIRQLEEAGDLKVEISNGILTTHGMTNRYYMVKFRQSIGLDTGELSDTPLEQGVNHGTPQGVNHSSPKLSVELSEELSVIISLPTDDTSKINSTAKGIITVYLKTTKTVNNNAYKFWMGEAQELARNNITQAHVAEWIKYFIGQAWWKDGFPDWKLMCSKIIAWRDEYADKKTEQQRQFEIMQRTMKRPLNYDQLEKDAS